MQRPSSMNDLPAFLTGSRVYGFPHAKSDLDLVVFCTQADKKILIYQSDNSVFPIRYSNLNLICCTTEDSYIGWKIGTKRCIARSPVTKTEAKQIFDEVRKELGITYEDDSGEGDQQDDDKNEDDRHLENPNQYNS